MILIINVCRESLHYSEFVNPVVNVLSSINERYFVLNYDNVTTEDLGNADKIIICGTSLYDNEYLEHIEKFSWIRTCNKPIFGICAGCQIIQIVYGGSINKIKEIGAVDIEFNEEFLGIIGKRKVYSLHQNVVMSNDFVVYAKSALCPHAVKHRDKEIYGVLFHPEVYNHDILENFCKS